jgi:hypothetical protein
LTYRLRILGWTMVALGAAGVALIAWLIAEMAKADAETQQAVLPWMAPLMLLGVIVYVAPLLIGGGGLLVGWKPAKWIIGTVCVLMLPAVPVGTAIGLFGLWGLLGDRLAKRAEAQAKAEQAKDMQASAGAPMISPRRRKSPRWAELPPRVQILILMGVSLGILGAMIGLGYIFREPLEAMDDSWIDTATERRGIVLVIGVVMAAVIGAWHLWQGNPLKWARYRREAREREAQQKVWVDKLNADPLTVKYADMMAKGEWWSPERVAYHMDRERTATCEHLRNLERAMRLAGIDVRLESTTTVKANCVFHAPAADVFAPPPTFYNENITDNMRSAGESPEAAFGCSQCRSWIRVVHPSEATKETPVFPTKGPEYQH